MGINDFNKTPEVSTSVESKSVESKNSIVTSVKLALAGLLLSINTNNAVAQNITPDTNKVLAQTEITTTGPVTIETILEKHHIIDLETATLEQLEWALADINLALSTITDKEQRKPFLLKKWTIRSQIEIRKSQLKTEQSAKQLEESTKQLEQAKKEREEAERVLGKNK